MTSPVCGAAGAVAKAIQRPLRAVAGEVLSSRADSMIRVSSNRPIGDRPRPAFVMVAMAATAPATLTIANRSAAAPLATTRPRNSLRPSLMTSLLSSTQSQRPAHFVLRLEPYDSDGPPLVSEPCEADTA